MATEGELGAARVAATYRMVRDELATLLLAARRAGRLSDMRFLRGQIRRVERALAAAEGAAASFVLTSLPAEYALSAAAADATLGAAGVSVAAGFGGVNFRALDRVAGVTGRAFREFHDSIAVGIALNDPGESARRIRAILDGDSELITFRGGVPRVVSQGATGALWEPDAYARMVARTQVAEARRQSFAERYLDSGVDVVRIVANGSAHGTCRVWEGVTCSLTGATPGLPTVDEARSAGLFHPNCRHRYVVDRAYLERQEQGAAPGVQLGATRAPLSAREVGDSRRPAESRRSAAPR